MREEEQDQSSCASDSVNSEDDIDFGDMNSSITSVSSSRPTQHPAPRPPLLMNPTADAMPNSGYLPLSNSVLSAYLGRELTKSEFEAIRNHFRRCNSLPRQRIQDELMSSAKKAEAQQIWDRGHSKRSYIWAPALEQLVAKMSQMSIGGGSSSSD